MQFTIKRAFLEQLLTKASSVVVRSQVEALLHTFLLETKGKTLEVVRTDGELSIVAQTDVVQVKETAGSSKILVQAEPFYELIKVLEGEDVEIRSVEDGLIEIESGAYKGEWKTQKLDKELHSVKKFEGKNVIKFDATQFVSVLDRACYAAAQEGIHRDLMQLVFADGKCWATDWHRYQEVSTGFPKNLHFNLPVGALDLAKFIRLSSVDVVEFERGEEFYFFRVGGDRFLCQIPKTPPANRADYTKLLVNKEKQGYFIMDVKRLISLVKRIRITSPDSRRIYFDVQDNALVVRGRSDMGTGEEAIRIKLAGYPNIKTKFAMDWEFLLEGLSVIKDKTIEVRISKMHLLLCGDDGVGIIGMVSDKNA